MNLDKSPLVSVILCTWNDEKYIAEAIHSILNQSYQNLEFIIVNDGSTDQTKAIIHSFSDPRIIYLEHPNQGQEFSKNRGIDRARGKYVAYMDGDDLSQPERLRTQVEFLESNPEIGICSTGIKLFGQQEREMLYYEKDESIRIQFLFNTAMAHPTCMIRRAILETHAIRYQQGWEAAEDYYFLHKVLEKTQAYCIQQALYNYRTHDKNISVTESAKQKKHAEQISFLVFNDVLKLSLNKSEHALLYALNRQEIGAREIKEVISIIQRIQAQIRPGTTQSSLVRQLVGDMYAKALLFLYRNASAHPSMFRIYLQSKIWQELPIPKFAFLHLKMIAKGGLGLLKNIRKTASDER